MSDKPERLSEDDLDAIFHDMVLEGASSGDIQSVCEHIAAVGSELATETKRVALVRQLILSALEGSNHLVNSGLWDLPDVMCAALSLLDSGAVAREALIKYRSQLAETDV